MEKTCFCEIVRCVTSFFPYLEDEPEQQEQDEDDPSADEEDRDVDLGPAVAAGHRVVRLQVEVEHAHDDHGGRDQDGEEPEGRQAAALLLVLVPSHLFFTFIRGFPQKSGKINEANTYFGARQ